MPYLFAALLILLLIAFTIGLRLQGALSDNELAAWVALTAAVIAAITALVTAYQSKKNAEKQGELSRELANLSENSQKRLEETRRIAEKKFPAHGEIYQAATAYYEAIRLMEVNKWSAQKVKDAARDADKVAGHKLYVNDEFWESWTSFRQICMNIEDERKLAQQVAEDTGRQLRDIWEKYCQQLSDKLAELERLARAELRLSS